MSMDPLQPTCVPLLLHDVELVGLARQTLWSRRAGLDPAQRSDR